MKSYLKFMLCFLLLLFYSQTSSACCAGERLQVLPSSNNIPQNPIFLVEFSGIKSNLKKFKRLYLKDQRGNIIDLEIIEGYGKKEALANHRSYDHQNRFVILKPNEKLPRNAVVSIVIETGIAVDKRMNKELGRLMKKTWKVKHKTDKGNPYFGSEITGKYFGHFNSSASGHSISCSMKAVDNYEYLTSFPAHYSEEQKIKYPRKQEMLIELTDENGFKSIYPLKDGTFYFANGACYRNFSLPSRINKGETKEFTFEARLMDFSGNLSKDTRLIKFKMMRKKEEKKEKITHNGVDYYRDNNGCNNKLGPAKLNMEGRTWVNIGSKNNCTYLDVYFAENYADQMEKVSTGEKPSTGNLLEQNTPNPATKETSIGYHLSKEFRSAFLKITDLTGKTIQSIPLLKKGQNQIIVNCGNMRAGIYFYTLIIDGEVMATRKMVVD